MGGRSSGKRVTTVPATTRGASRSDRWRDTDAASARVGGEYIGDGPSGESERASLVARGVGAESPMLESLPCRWPVSDEDDRRLRLCGNMG